MASDGVDGRAAGDLVPLDASHGCWASGLASIHFLAAGISSSRLATSSSTMPDLLALGRAHALALEQQLHQRVDDPEHPHGAGDAAGAREQAELDLGEAELDLGVIDHDPVMAGQADLQAAAERGAVDRRHDRLARASPGAAAPPCPRARSRRSPRRSPWSPRLRSLRSPPAKKVFLAEVMITPVISSCSASRRSTVASIDAA